MLFFHKKETAPFLRVKNMYIYMYFKADNLKSLFYLDIQTYLNSVFFFLYLCDNEISIF